MSLREHKLSLIEGIEKELHSNLYKIMNEGWYIFCTKYLMRARAFTLALFYTVAHDILYSVGVLGNKFKERHRKWSDMVKGKGLIHKKGSASLHLRDISEYKKGLSTDNRQQTTEQQSTDDKEQTI